MHDEINHHGVLGQKWGVRNYQNSDGSLTAAGKSHVSDYKAKESAAVVKKYDSKSKWTKSESKKYYNELMKKAELSKIKKMKLTDIEAEKKTVGKAVLKNVATTVAISVAASAVTIPAIGFGVTSVPRVFTTASNAKTNSRVSKSERMNYASAAVSKYS